MRCCVFDHSHVIIGGSNMLSRALSVNEISKGKLE